MDKKEQNEIKEVIREVFKEEFKSSEFKEAVREAVKDDFDHQAEMIQGEFKRINKRFDSFEARVSKLEERVTQVEERLGLISRQLENISDSVAELRAERKHDVIYVTSLEEKMLAERNEAQNEYQTLVTKISNLESRISKLEAKPNG